MAVLVQTPVQGYPAQNGQYMAYNAQPYGNPGQFSQAPAPVPAPMPVAPAPVAPAPVMTPPVNQVPVNQAPINQMPINQAPINQASVVAAPLPVQAPGAVDPDATQMPYYAYKQSNQENEPENKQALEPVVEEPVAEEPAVEDLSESVTEVVREEQIIDEQVADEPAETDEVETESESEGEELPVIEDVEDVIVESSADVDIPVIEEMMSGEATEVLSKEQAEQAVPVMPVVPIAGMPVNNVAPQMSQPQSESPYAPGFVPQMQNPSNPQVQPQMMNQGMPQYQQPVQPGVRVYNNPAQGMGGNNMPSEEKIKKCREVVWQSGGKAFYIVAGVCVFIMSVLALVGQFIQ